MKKFLCIMSFAGCGYSLFALITQVFPKVINYNEGLGWLSFLVVPLYTITLLILWLVSTKAQAKNKLLLLSTIGAIVLMAVSFANLFFDFIPFSATTVVIQDIISTIILIVWIVYCNTHSRKNIT